MNLFKLHTSPGLLDLYTEANDSVPDLFWNKYEHDPNELKKRERAIATSARYSYLYAADVLKDRFPRGEKAIATSDQDSYYYAKNVLNGPFALGETAIATSAYYSYQYAKHVLYNEFPLGEKAIAQGSIDYINAYRTFTGIQL